MAIFMNGDGSTNKNLTNTFGVSNNTALGTSPIVSGGGFKNPSNNMVNAVSKVKNNVQQSIIPKTNYDNKIIGTNQAKQTVYNYTNNISPFAQTASKIKTLPDSAPLSDAERASRLRADLVSNYNMTKTLDDYVNSMSKNIQSSPVQTSNGTFAFDPSKDIGTQISAFLSMNPSYSKEAADVLTQMQNARAAKILAHPELNEYINDDIYKRARAFLSKGDVENGYARSEEILSQAGEDVNQKVDMMTQIANLERERQIKEAEAAAIQQRRNLLANAPISDLQMQEQLSAMGLSRGANNSSGYGETARLANQLNVNNQISDNYNQLAKNVSEYNNAYTDAAMQAQMQGMTENNEYKKLLADLALDRALKMYDVDKDNRDFEYTQQRDNRTDYVDDRNYETEKEYHEDEMKYKYDTMNQDEKHFYANLALEQYKAEAEIRLQERGLSLDEARAQIERAQIIFETTGVANDIVSATFGIPVSTQLWDVIKTDKQIAAEIQLANIGASSSGSSGGSGLSIDDVLALEDEQDTGAQIPLYEILKLGGGPRNIKY